MKITAACKPIDCNCAKYKIEVRFTNTYKNNQNIAMINATDSLYLVFKKLRHRINIILQIYRYKPYCYNDQRYCRNPFVSSNGNA